MQRLSSTIELRYDTTYGTVSETEAMMSQKLSYIHDNPVERGYICDPTHWRYSSARNYAKMEPLSSVTTDW